MGYKIIITFRLQIFSNRKTTFKKNAMYKFRENLFHTNTHEKKDCNFINECVTYLRLNIHY